MIDTRIGKFKALVITGIAVTSVILGMWTYNRIYAANSSEVKFGPDWHYVGNVTLTGTLAQQVCSALPIPSCFPGITFPAQEYTNDTATAYLTVLHGTSPYGNSTAYAVIINSAAYCASVFINNRENPPGHLQNCPPVIT